jgi:hypothetical protein
VDKLYLRFSLRLKKFNHSLVQLTKIVKPIFAIYKFSSVLLPPPFSVLERSVSRPLKFPKPLTTTNYSATTIQNYIHKAVTWKKSCQPT